jgi:plasmid maintenance system antidote protein VapI
MNNNIFRPDWRSPTSDTVKDELEERGWSAKDLAEKTEHSLTFIREFLYHDAPLTEDFAKRLSDVFGTSVEFWIRREQQYRS